MTRPLVPVVLPAALLAAVLPAPPATACVGRTLLVGYYDAPDR